MAGFLDNFGAQSNSGVFSRIAETARKIGNFGMEYKDLVVKNSQAMGAAEYSMRERFGFAQEDEDFIYSIAAQDTSNRKYIASFDKEVPFKIEFLRNFAMNPEIEYILDTICDDGIVYDKKNFFCQPSLLNLDLKPECYVNSQKDINMIASCSRSFDFHIVSSNQMAEQIRKHVPEARCMVLGAGEYLTDPKIFNVMNDIS